MGYLHEVLKEEKGVKGIDNVPAPGGAHKNFNEPPLIADQLAAEADVEACKNIGIGPKAGQAFGVARLNHIDRTAPTPGGH
jgi:hypothetical protein